MAPLPAAARGLCAAICNPTSQGAEMPILHASNATPEAFGAWPPHTDSRMLQQFVPGIHSFPLLKQGSSPPADASIELLSNAPQSQ